MSNNNQDDQPKGFSKWFGRIIGAILIVLAVIIAAVAFTSGSGTSESSDSSTSAPAQQQGIRLP